ncbi:MAG: hypothetical protein ACE5OS_13315 [Anaerolineae bacterium]
MPQHHCPLSRPSDESPDARVGEQTVQQLGIQEYHFDQIERARTDVEINVGQRAGGAHHDVLLPLQVVIQLLTGQHVPIHVTSGSGEHPAQARRKAMFQAL